MKQLRKWMLVSVCAPLGAAAVLYAVLWLMYRTPHWWTYLGLKQFDWVSRDALVDCLAIGFILGVGLTLGAVGGVWLGLSLERRLPSTGGRSANRQTA